METLILYSERRIKMMEDYEKNEELEVLDEEETEEETEDENSEEPSVGAVALTGAIIATCVVGGLAIAKSVYKKAIKPAYNKVVGAIIRKKAFSKEKDKEVTELNEDDIIEFDKDEIIITKEETEEDEK